MLILKFIVITLIVLTYFLEKTANNNQIPVYAGEPNLNILTSVIFKEHRIRMINSGIYIRHPNETFHEFIESLALDTFGEAWLKKQTNPEHILVKYAKEYYRRRKEGALIDVCKEADGNFSAISSGPVLFWLLFCYDVFVLTHKNVLPDELKVRLKDHKGFQGARYELAIAAIFLRAGFDIAWVDKNKQEDKSCEFIATHRKTGKKVGVEAKSKKRKGVLHEAAGSNSDQGLSNLLKDASKKKSELPLIIFIDSNLPFALVPSLEKPIFREVKRAIGALPADKDSFNLLVITSFPFHYTDFDQIALPPENIIVFPFNNAWLDSNLFDDLQNSINRYSIMPEEI